MAIALAGLGSVHAALKACRRQDADDIKKVSGVVLAEAFGAAGDGITDDTAALRRGLSVAHVIANGTYHVTDLELTDSDPIYFSGRGTLKTSVIDEPAFHINSQGSHMKGARIEGLHLRQPNSPHLASGTANNHACLRVQGVDDFVASNLDMSGSDIAASFCFGAANLPYRANRRLVGKSFRAFALRGMGLELFGCQNGSFTGHHFVGTDGYGGRAMFHGVRFAAYEFAPNRTLDVSLIAENFVTGASFQRYTSAVTCRLTAINCSYGVHVHGSVEGLSAAEVSRGNQIAVNAIDCDMVLLDGGSDNSFEITARGCGNGIRSLSGAAGIGENNSYAGRVEEGRGRLAWIRQDKARLNLTLAGLSPKEAEFGLLLDGSGGQGQISVVNCEVGGWVNGSRNSIQIAIRDCTTGLVVTGNDNVIVADLAGDLVIEGDNNVVRGRITGPIADRGRGNKLETDP